MSVQPFVPPTFSSKAFNCPHCKAFARQHWLRIFDVANASVQYNPLFQQLYVVRCEHCSGFEVWYREAMIVPEQANAPLAHPELPAALKEDYDEARGVLAKSPRSACALLRLTIQKLCGVLGESGEKH